MILDYSESLVHRTRDLLDGADPHDPYFYSRRGFCPFCSVSVPVLEQGSCGIASWHPDIGGTGGAYKVWQCGRCGWWEIEKTEYSGGEQLLTYFDTKLRHGILRKYDVDAISIPTQALASHIAERPRLIHKIHPGKLEELVQSVFTDFFDCEIKHVGRSHDGGLDLVVVFADMPAAVQVKRREAPDKSESVTVVREFLGAMLLEGFQRGYVVTTREKFSVPARKASERAVTRGLVTEFELIDLPRFLEMLDLVNADGIAYWKKYVKKRQYVTHVE